MRPLVIPSRTCYPSELTDGPSTPALVPLTLTLPTQEAGSRRLPNPGKVPYNYLSTWLPFHKTETPTSTNVSVGFWYQIWSLDGSI